MQASTAAQTRPAPPGWTKINSKGLPMDCNWHLLPSGLKTLKENTVHIVFKDFQSKLLDCSPGTQFYLLS